MPYNSLFHFVHFFYKEKKKQIKIINYKKNATFCCHQTVSVNWKRSNNFSWNKFNLKYLLKYTKKKKVK